jgi:hypothetical protein
MSNRSVYKYKLPLTNSPGEIVKLHLPVNAVILKVDQQGGDPVLGPHFWVWALVDPDEKLNEIREVLTAGTGHTIPKTALDRIHQRDTFPPIGRKTFQETVLAMNGQLVIHIWISQAVGKVAPVEVSADNV